MIRHILFWNYTKEVKENHLEKETLQKLKESVQTLELQVMILFFIVSLKI